MFGALMFSPVSKKDKQDLTSTELHLLQIITQLFLHTTDVRYLRTLNKFKEQEMIKTERTVELLVKYQNRVDEAEDLYKKQHHSAAAAAGTDSKDEVETYARHSEHGLGHVELATIVLAFLTTAGEPAVSTTQRIRDSERGRADRLNHEQLNLTTLLFCACVCLSASRAR